MPPVVIREEYLAVDSLSLLESAFLSEVKHLHDSSGCFAHYKHMAARLKVTDRTIRNLVPDLCKRGFLAINDEYLVPLPIPDVEKISTCAERVSAMKAERISKFPEKISKTAEAISYPSKQEVEQELKQEALPLPSPTPRTWKDDPQFVEMWNAYPVFRRNESARPWAVWQKQTPAIREQITMHVQAMAETYEWQKQDGAFAPMIATYFNQQRWNMKIPPKSFGKPQNTHQQEVTERNAKINRNAYVPTTEESEWAKSDGGILDFSKLMEEQQ